MKAIITIICLCILGYTGYLSHKLVYEKGKYAGYNEYIGTFVPAEILPNEIPVKKPNPKLMEKFKG